MYDKWQLCIASHLRLCPKERQEDTLLCCGGIIIVEYVPSLLAACFCFVIVPSDGLCRLALTAKECLHILRGIGRDKCKGLVVTMLGVGEVPTADATQPLLGGS